MRKTPSRRKRSRGSRPLDAEEGGKAVTQTVEAMKAIAVENGHHRERSPDSTEHARAETRLLRLRGPASTAKGFAVVASEVGKTRRAQPERGKRNQLSFRAERPDRRKGRRNDHEHHSRHSEDRRPRSGNQRREQRAKRRGPANQSSFAPARQSRPTERLRLGRVCFHVRRTREPGRGIEIDDFVLQDRRFIHPQKATGKGRLQKPHRRALFSGQTRIPLVLDEDGNIPSAGDATDERYRSFLGL